MAIEYGLLEQEEHSAKEWGLAGGVSGVSENVLRPDGQWDDFLPEFESQWKDGFDTYACVTFSALNCIETLVKVRYDKDINKSDRFVAKMSDTRCGYGNWLYKVADTIKEQGSCDEVDYPFSDGLVCETYYAEIPEDLKLKAKLLIEDYDIKWEWAYNYTLQEGLTYAPLQVTIWAYGKRDSNDIYQHPGTTKSNHAVMLYGYKEGEYWKIYDHYANKFKKLAWDYPMTSQLKFEIIKKLTQPPMPTIKVDNDTLVQDVEDSGAIGMVLDDKIIVDDLAKVLATWQIRNNGNTVGKVRSLKKDEWDSFQKMNISKQPI